MEKELEYTGKSKGAQCAICKLSFKDSKKILFCPECNSLFHREHLISWLQKNSNCPVCTRDFSKEIEKYHLKDFNEDIQEEIIQSGNLSKQPFKLINKDIRRQPRIFEIVMMIVGMLIVMLSAVFIFITPFPYVFAGVLLYGSIFIFGMYVIKSSKTNLAKNIDNYWKTITFTKKGIIVESIDTTTHEILLDDIINIRQTKINMDEESEPVVGRRKQYYKIILEIITQNQGKYSFNPIFRSTNIGKREEAFRDLHSQIKNLYNIETIQPKTFVQRFLGKIKTDKIFLLFSGIIFVILNAILIPIGYFFV